MIFHSFISTVVLLYFYTNKCSLGDHRILFFKRHKTLLPFPNFLTAVYTKMQYLASPWISCSAQKSHYESKGWGLIWIVSLIEWLPYYMQTDLNSSCAASTATAKKKGGKKKEKKERTISQKTSQHVIHHIIESYSYEQTNFPASHILLHLSIAHVNHYWLTSVIIRERQ